MTTTFDELLKQHNDLCLRVSRNHDDVSAIARSEIHPTRCDLANLSYRTNQLEKKVEKIDTVLDHDTDSMLLSNLCKRVTDLELVEIQRVAYKVEPVPIDPRFGSGDSRPHEVIELFNGLRTKLRERYNVAPDVLEQIDILARQIASKFSHGGRNWWQT